MRARRGRDERGVCHGRRERRADIGRGERAEDDGAAWVTRVVHGVDGEPGVTGTLAGPTLRALAALDASAARDALAGVFDKLTSFEEAGVMVDELADGFSALSAVTTELAVRIGEETDDEHVRKHMVLGCAIGLLALVQYGHAEQMRRQFGDAAPS